MLINQYDEYGPGMGLPKMEEFFEEKPYDGIEKIVKYLKGGKTTLVSLTMASDFYTKEPIGVREEIRTDGEFSWSSTLFYYVERYYLRLPKEFEEKILSLNE